mgnify:CR=1 FL=1
MGHAGEPVHHGLLHELHLIAVELDMGVHPGFDDGGFEGLGHIVHRPQHQPPLLIHELTTCHTAEEGLQAAKEGGWSLILLDVVMPGMDGFQLIQALKADEATRQRCRCTP